MNPSSWPSLVLLFALLSAFGAMPGVTKAASPPAASRSAASPEVVSERFESRRPNGTRAFGSHTTWELSGGEVAEAYLLTDGDGRGEGYLAIDGQIIAQVELSPDLPLAMTNVGPPEVGPALIAELLHSASADDLLVGLVPQEFKCSAFGRKALKAGKYAWTGLVAAASGMCCIASEGIACPVCLGAGAVATLAGQEAADGYCE